jgi:3-deoxy-D-manno-octulosonic-acid transferase
MFLLYELLLWLVTIVALPYFLLVGLMRGKYLGSMRERLGIYRSPAAAHDLWLHAVSVGEVAAAKLVLDRVRELRPDLSVVVSTTTATGQASARRTFPDLRVTYVPFDFSFSVRRFLRHHQPRIFASMETEIWPNTVRLTSDRGIPLLLLNARLSDSSYPRYRRVRLFLGSILRRYTAILAREERDRQRFVDIGAPANVVEVSGNVKFDFRPDEQPLAIEPLLRQWIGSRKLMIAGSTMEGEDELLIPALPRLLEAGMVVAIAPRKPERFAVVAGLLAKAGIRFARRTSIESLNSSDSVLLVDSIGELARMYRFAAAAFIGGSLVPSGGHNPIEAAAVGTPVAFGPHMSNFRDVAATFLADDAARQVNGVEDLIRFALQMAADERDRAQLSGRARETVERNRGASMRNAQRIVELLA